MAAVRKVLIVGGGIAGLATAIALGRQGIACDVVELQQDWKVYHVGIVVQANFIRAMAALGIADQAVSAGYPFTDLVFQDLHGHVLAVLHGASLAGPDYPTRLGMTRPALHAVLFAAASNAGARLYLATTFTQIEQGDDSVRVIFNDGEVDDYDLVIGADGIYSQVRAHVFGKQFQPHFTGQGTWRYNVTRPPELTYSINCRGEELPRGKCGFIPLTQNSGYVWLVQHETNQRHAPQQLADLFRERLNACTGVMAQLREQICDAAQVVYRPLQVIMMPPPWYCGRVLLIGDAAHATTPHLGQGSAQAVEDAVVLGELLQRDVAVETLLREFMQRRYERCRFIVESSVQVGHWEQHPELAGDPVALTAKMLEVVAAPI